MLKLRGWVGGLLLGFGVVGLGLGTLYLVPRYLQPVFAPVYQTEHFAVYYRRDAQIAEKIKLWGVQLEQEFAQGLAALGMTVDKLSLPLEVVVTDDREELAREIQRRRNPYRGGVPKLFLGISQDQELRGPLWDFLLRLTWGNSTLRLLRIGLIAALTQPPPESAVAALPARLTFTLEELLHWERRRGFTASMPINWGDDLVFPSESLAQVHATTLVRFLLELGGQSKLRQLWRRSPFEDAVSALYGLALTDLDDRWRAWVEEQGRAAPAYSFYRGKYLAAVGRRAEAVRFLESARAAGDKRATAELQRLHCEQAQYYRTGGDLCTCLWESIKECRYGSRASENFVVHYAQKLEREAERILARAEASLADSLRLLHMSRRQLPSLLVIFLHVGEARPFSVTEALRGVVRVSVEESVGYAVARMVLQHWQKHQTYSDVLRRGLAYYLDHSGRNYLKEAERLSMTEDWVPFASLDFEAYKFESVRVGAAAMIGYLLESYGIEKLRELWTQTAPLGGDRSLDGALRAVYGLTREQLERELIALWARETTK